jgi:uncharacterized protein YndB with AHSA1/START domain
MERKVSNLIAEAVVRKSVRVQAPIERLLRLRGTDGDMVACLAPHWKNPFESIFVEPRVGGRWYERDAAGNLNDWGTVLAWDPPHRVTFSWHIGPGHDQPDWVCDPDMAKASEVEIKFTAEGPGTTLVELEHSRLERHGEGYEQLRAIFDGPGAWSRILALYAKAAQRER